LQCVPIAGATSTGIRRTNPSLSPKLRVVEAAGVTATIGEWNHDGAQHTQINSGGSDAVRIQAPLSEALCIGRAGFFSGFIFSRCYSLCGRNLIGSDHIATGQSEKT
jgi:hypothetical protein